MTGRTRRGGPVWSLAVALLVVVIGVVVYVNLPKGGSTGAVSPGSSSSSSGPGSSGSGSSVGASGTALATLATLPVRAAGTKAGYTRAQFGQAWADVDRNGCDTRDDVLQRDLTGTRRRSDSNTASGLCVVLSGTLADPYTATKIAFSKSKATAVQIDHVVALSDAWQTGASTWTATKREQFANDPGNLLAVDGPSNEAKGDSDASEWLPPSKAYRCPYVARQIGVKARYGLWVTPAERDAMRAVLSGCRTQVTLSS